MSNIDHASGRAELDRVRSAIEALGNITASTANEVLDNDRNFAILEAVSLAVSIIAVAMSALNVLNALIMATQERTREIGIFAAIGWSRARIMMSIVIEGLLMCVIGCVLGVLLSFLAATAFPLIPAIGHLISFRAERRAGRAGARGRLRALHPRLADAGVAGGADDAGGSAAAAVSANMQDAGRGSLAGAAAGGLRLALSQLIEQIRMPPAPGTICAYPRLRNFLLDVLAEGRRKNIAHVLLEADIAGVREQLAELQARGEPVSMTSYIAKSFACAIEQDKRMQAYRLGRSRLIVFDDIDITFMIEREWESEPIPVFHVLRAAQQKSARDIHRELRAAKETPLGTTGPMSALEMRFFLLPAFLRKALWFLVRRKPYWFKDLAGTVGITSMGMYTSGAAVGVPITPMTLTLSIGAIERKPAIGNGTAIECDVVHLNLSVDHDVIDGAALMRFADRFKQILRERTALLPTAAAPAQRSRGLEA